MERDEFREESAASGRATRSVPKPERAPPAPKLAESAGRMKQRENGHAALKSVRYVMRNALIPNLRSRVKRFLIKL